MKSKRLDNIDFIKGIAIFFVMLGHFIQYYVYNGNVEFLQDPAFRWIYTFHMPLFMAISGYIFWTVQRDKPLSVIIGNRLRGIGIPLITWGILCAAVKMVESDYVTWRSVFAMLLKEIYGIWFLWSILICTCLLACIEKLKCNGWQRALIHFAVFLLLLKVPNGGYYMFMYPFYLLGYLCHQNEQHILYYKYPICVVALLSFIILGCGFGEQHYIYTTWIDPLVSPYGVKRQILIDFYRYATGLVGTISVVCICNYVYNKLRDSRLTKIMVSFGKNSLQLYLTQKLFLELIGPRVISAGGGTGSILTYIFSAIIVFMLGCVFYVVNIPVNNNRITAFLFYGKKI